MYPESELKNCRHSFVQIIHMLQSYMKYTFKVLMKKVFAFAYKKKPKHFYPGNFFISLNQPLYVILRNFRHNHNYG